eukprot:UN10405
MGMIATTTSDEPPLHLVHTIPRCWTTLLFNNNNNEQNNNTEQFNFIWNDVGGGGSAGSIWTSNELYTLHATPGHQPPKDKLPLLYKTTFTTNNTSSISISNNNNNNNI